MTSPMDPLEPMDAPHPADPYLTKLADARALIWQERQERVYAGRILQGFHSGALERTTTLYDWAHRVMVAHDLCEESE